MSFENKSQNEIIEINTYSTLEKTKEELKDFISNNPDVSKLENLFGNASKNSIEFFATAIEKAKEVENTRSKLKNLMEIV